MKATTFSGFKAKMKSYLDYVSINEDVLLIPLSSKKDDAVVILPVKKYNSLTETNNLSSTYENAKKLKDTINQLRQH